MIIPLWIVNNIAFILVLPCDCVRPQDLNCMYSESFWQALNMLWYVLTMFAKKPVRTGDRKRFSIMSKLLMNLRVRHAGWLAQAEDPDMFPLYFLHSFSILLPSLPLYISSPWQFYLYVVYQRALPGLIHSFFHFLFFFCIRMPESFWL